VGLPGRQPPASVRYNHPMEEQKLERPEPAVEEELAMLYCPVCSTRLTGRQCKLLCEKCGYYMSCADYY
jgi:hypothetical protein